jgi:hypothetical protein
MSAEVSLVTRFTHRSSKMSSIIRGLFHKNFQRTTWIRNEELSHQLCGSAFIQSTMATTYRGFNFVYLWEGGRLIETTFYWILVDLQIILCCWHDISSSTDLSVINKCVVFVFGKGWRLSTSNPIRCWVRKHFKILSWIYDSVLSIIHNMRRPSWRKSGHLTLTHKITSSNRPVLFKPFHLRNPFTDWIFSGTPPLS